MIELVDEKDIEAFYEGQTYGEDFIERSIETLAAALRVVRAAQGLCEYKLRTYDEGHRWAEVLREALKPFSESHTSSRGEDAPKEK